MDYLAIKTLKKQVGYILENFRETRDSDAELVKIVSTKFNLDPIQKASGIERCRRWYNQNGQFLPLKEATARHRGLNMSEWRVAMGYPTEQGSYTPPSMEDVVAKVPSKSRRGIFYYINRASNGFTCSCDAYKYGKGVECKHIGIYREALTEAAIKESQRKLL